MDSSSSIESKLYAGIRSISNNIYWAMGTAFLLGLVTHITPITSFIVNGDSSIPVANGNWLLTQGKWLFGWIQSLRGNVNLVTVSGPIALLWLTVSAGVVTSILEFKRPLFCILTGAMMVTFPTVMCNFCYQGQDIFFFAMLLSCISVWLIRKTKYGWLTGTLVLVLSVGIYQAYIGLAAGLLLMLCLLDLLDGTKSIPSIIRQGLSYIAILAVAAALYYCVLQVCLKINAASLSGYRSINQLGTFNLQRFLILLKESYQKVIRFFLRDAYGVGNTLFRFLYCFTLFLAALLYLIQAVRTRLFFRPAYLLLTILLVPFFPLAIHAIAILGQNSETHWLMIYSFLLVFLFPVKLADALPDCILHTNAVTNKRENIISKLSFSIKGVTALLSLCLIFNWYLVSTQNYSRMRLAYEGAYSTCSSLATRIAMQSGFTKETPVVVIGYIEDDSDDFTYLDRFTGTFDKDLLFNSWIVEQYILNYVQADMTFVENNVKNEVEATDAFASMPIYPDDGCIQTIEGRIIVRLSEHEEVKFGS